MTDPQTTEHPGVMRDESDPPDPAKGGYVWTDDVEQVTVAQAIAFLQQFPLDMIVRAYEGEGGDRIIVEQARKPATEKVP